MTPVAGQNVLAQIVDTCSGSKILLDFDTSSRAKYTGSDCWYL